MVYRLYDSYQLVLQMYFHACNKSGYKEACMCLDMCLGVHVWCMHVPGHVSGHTCTVHACVWTRVWVYIYGCMHVFVHCTVCMLARLINTVY